MPSIQRLPCASQSDWTRWTAMGAAFLNPYVGRPCWQEAAVPSDKWVTSSKRQPAFDRCETTLRCISGGVACFVNEKSASYDSWLQTSWQSLDVEREQRRLAQERKEQKQRDKLYAAGDCLRKGTDPLRGLSPRDDFVALPGRTDNPIDWRCGRLRMMLVLADGELERFLIPLHLVPAEQRLLLMAADHDNRDVGMCGCDVPLDQAPFDGLLCLRDPSFRNPWRVEQHQGFTQYGCSIMSVSFVDGVAPASHTCPDCESKRRQSSAWLANAHAWQRAVTERLPLGTRIRCTRPANSYQGACGTVVGVNWPAADFRMVVFDGEEVPARFGLEDLEALSCDQA